MKTTLIFLNIVTGFLALASAFCWSRSSTTTVKYTDDPEILDGSYRSGTTVVDGNDFFATAKKQSYWNKLAATLAALAALTQASVAGLGAFPD